MWTDVKCEENSHIQKSWRWYGSKKEARKFGWLSNAYFTNPKTSIPALTKKLKVTKSEFLWHIHIEFIHSC